MAKFGDGQLLVAESVGGGGDRRFGVKYKIISLHPSYVTAESD